MKVGKYRRWECMACGMRHKGIKHERTIRKTPEQNGVAECMNRTLVESVQCMLSGSKLPKSFWTEALATAVYVKNRSPANSLKDKTPYEALFDLKPSVKHFKTFFVVFVFYIFQKMSVRN